MNKTLKNTWLPAIVMAGDIAWQPTLDSFISGRMGDPRTRLKDKAYDDAMGVDVNWTDFRLAFR